MCYRHTAKTAHCNEIFVHATPLKCKFKEYYPVTARTVSTESDSILLLY